MVMDVDAPSTAPEGVLSDETVPGDIQAMEDTGLSNAGPGPSGEAG